MQWAIAQLFFCLNMAGVMAYAISLPSLMGDLKLSTSQVGSLGGIYFVVYALSQLLLGSLFGRVPARLLLGGSALVASLGALSMATAQGFLMVLAARVLMGIGFGAAFVGVIYVVNQRFPARFPVMTNVSQSAANMVGAALGLLSASLPFLGNFRISFFAVCVLLLLNGLFLLSALKDQPAQAATGDAREPDSLPRILATILRSGQFWLATLFFAGLFASFLAYADLWNIQFQSKTFGSSDAMAPVVNSTVAWGLVVGGVVTGWWADRVGFLLPARVSSWASLVLLIVLQTGRLPLDFAIVLMGLLGFFMGCAPLGLSAMKAHLPPSAVAMGSSILLSVVFLSGGLLTPAVGMSIAALPMASFGTYQLAMRWFIVFTAVSAVSSLLLRPGRSSAEA